MDKKQVHIIEILPTEQVIYYGEDFYSHTTSDCTKREYPDYERELCRLMKAEVSGVTIYTIPEESMYWDSVKDYNNLPIPHKLEGIKPYIVVIDEID